MKHILFICTGNTCRSCMAEGFFNTLVLKSPQLGGEFLSTSAGISAASGMGASENSVQVLKNEWQIDISSHRSRSISKDQVTNAHLILTMTDYHKIMLISLFPQALNKIFTLKEYVSSEKKISREERDIRDPYGGSLETYSFCALEIKNQIDELIKKLEKENEFEK